MKKYLEKQAFFSATLSVFALFAKSRTFNRLTYFLTTLSAKVNLKLNKPRKADNVQELAQRWQAMMPPDGQENFRIRQADDKTALVEIHLHCPLRGSGNPDACYRLMNYDRQLIKNVGGQLVVLESQSNSGKHFCQLAIRKSGEDISDLKPAHES
jgi:hypothetical protein